MNRALLLLLSALSLAGLPSGWAAESMGSFKSDGCTAFADGTRQNATQWFHCCFEHDLRFWAGGSEQARDRADLRLRDCVRETGARKTAQLMYRMVRLTRNSPIRFPDRQWGNGWRDGRPRYQRLTREDIDRIQSELDSIELPAAVRESFLETIFEELQEESFFQEP